MTFVHKLTKPLIDSQIEDMSIGVGISDTLLAVVGRGRVVILRFNWEDTRESGVLLSWALR